MNKLVPGVELAALSEIRNTAGERPRGRVFMVLPLENSLGYKTGAIRAAVGKADDLANNATFAQLIKKRLIKEVIEHRRDARLFIPGKDAQRYLDTTSVDGSH